MPSDAQARALRLLSDVPLIDGHNDLPWELRANFHSSFDSLDIATAQSAVMTDIPRLRTGKVGAQFWSTYTPSDIEQPARAGMEQVDLVHRMVERYPDVFEWASTADDIVRIHRAGEIASMAGLEGGHMIENSLALLRAFYREGVRYMTLTHSRNTDWADAATDTLAHGGLTPFGEEVVREMNRVGMLVDLSHASDSTMWDVLRVTEAPVVLSHTSSRHFTPHPRNIPDDLAQAVAQNGGVIMVTFVLPFISQPAYEYYELSDSVTERLRRAGLALDALRDSLRSWREANPMPVPDVGVVADHMDHLRAVAGVDHIGIGSDFDGIGVPPNGLEDVGQFPNLIAELIRRGWSDEDVRKVIGLNVLRIMRDAERVAVRLQQTRPPSVSRIEDLDGR
ncbi:MAG: dipeptidase [Gemmatimonadota bacterium]|nr:dipeptidase [Gemmatimonadota bacterium]MDH3367637.1 dipeptidase [Gemmatimonadota bacterium]MDH3478422.1 dipeptidase [Gemmatimonadota bacterium]MDH3568757.1 dipeptidase [Gemmatimonadota bacterium]MDH5549384.1 dipeptidase [Gemmatimonadota bacterium]